VRGDVSGAISLDGGTGWARVDEGRKLETRDKAGEEGDSTVLV
jgi:hypothetical protein